MKLLKIVFLFLPFIVISQIKKEDIPKFKDEKLNEYVQLYANHVNEYVKCKGNIFKGDLINSSKNLGKKGMEVMSKIKVNDAKVFSNFASKLTEKIKEIESYKATKEKEDFFKLTGIKVPNFNYNQANTYIKYYIFYADEYIKKKGKLSEDKINGGNAIKKEFNQLSVELTKKELQEIQYFLKAVDKKMIEAKTQN